MQAVLGFAPLLAASDQQSSRALAAVQPERATLASPSASPSYAAVKRKQVARWIFEDGRKHDRIVKERRQDEDPHFRLLPGCPDGCPALPGGCARACQMPDKGGFPAAMIAGQGKCGTNALAEALYRLQYNYPLTQYSIAVEEASQGFAGEVNWPEGRDGCTTFADEKSLADYKQLFSPVDGFGYKWLDKSTANLGCAKELAGSFPKEVKFLNMVCDPVMAVWSRMNHLRQEYGKDKSNPSELNYVLQQRLSCNTSCEVLARSDARLDKQVELCWTLQDGLELPDIIRQWKMYLGGQTQFLLAERARNDRSYLARKAASHLGVPVPDNVDLEVDDVHTNADEDTYIEPEGLPWESFINTMRPVFKPLIMELEAEHPEFTGLAALWPSVF